MDSLLDDCHAILLQGVVLLRSLDEAGYSQKHAYCFNSSIGGHIRHNLDHYWSFLRGVGEGEIDYDARARDVAIESNPELAACATEEIAADLIALKGSELDRDVRVKMDTGSYALPEEEWSRSTPRRELQFLLSHTVHHYALISVMCHRVGIALEPDFGVAPSTLKYQRTRV